VGARADAGEKGTLYGVSVGPGDPENLTLRAVRVLKAADVIAAPSTGRNRQTALGIVADYIAGKPVVDCVTPMSKDPAVIAQAHDRIADDLCALLDEGKSVAFITLGDVGVYSTYYYTHARVAARGYRTEVVPGVTSFCDAAARLGRPLCLGAEPLLIVPVSTGNAEALLDLPANKVFMKAGRDLGELRETLAARGELDDTAAVANSGLPREQVCEKFADLDVDSGYFSVVLYRAGNSEG
jgi:precorrin-2/cobalt-factor-2 C20-methyltransferase